MENIRKTLGVLTFGISLLMGHIMAITQIYGLPVTLEQVLWLIPHYLLYIFWISGSGFMGFVSYQLIIKGYHKGLDRVLGIKRW